MDDSKTFCLECRAEVEASQPVCCEWCYSQLKKDVRELLGIKHKLEEFIDKHEVKDA